MRRVLSCILLLLAVVSLHAMHVECVGNAAIWVNEGDTIFVFEGDIHLRSKVGNIVWYEASTSSEYASGTDEIFPDEGGYYIEVEGQKEYFYVFSYEAYRPSDLQLQVTPECEQTLVTLSGTIPKMQYERGGVIQTVSRQCTISFMDLAWNSTDMQWEDSVATSGALELREGTYILPPMYQSTEVVLLYDKPLCQDLNLPLDSVIGTMNHPIANKAQPTSITTVRGTDNERSNEMERPKDSQVLKGSAPLDILFRANGTEAVEYYDWKIYFGSTLLASRTDAEHRYVFQEPGNYRVVCRVSNSVCSNTDSTEMLISVSTSMLRVPNVFTPNGDGQNDEFRVAYRSIKEFDCWVYNRWGKLVFHWDDPAKGWDGTINGRPAAEGAYFYVIRARGTDAQPNANYTSKVKYNKNKLNAEDCAIGIYQLSGDINLLRGENNKE